jgi:hypothetical protein
VTAMMEAAVEDDLQPLEAADLEISGVGAG